MGVITQARPSSETTSQRVTQKGRDSAQGGQTAQASKGNFAGILENSKSKMNAMTSLESVVDRSKGIPLDPAERARVNNMAKAEMDMKRTAALNALAQLEGGGSLLDSARGALNTRHLTAMGNFSLRSPTAMGGVGAAGGARKSSGRKSKSAETTDVSTEGIGKLAAQFESGKDGIAAIGYDRHGGTSYGKYQVASRVGSMENFLKFLDTNAPDISKTLRESGGPANTGSRQGAMPDAWRKIAAEQPERFEALQEKFIHDSHYKPALQAMVQNTPLEEGQISSAMQEVIWSTAVQHGPTGAARIFTRAAAELSPKDKNFDKKLIENVYDIRAGQFGSSTQEVRAAVQNRLKREKNIAINMLNGDDSGVKKVA